MGGGVVAPKLSSVNHTMPPSPLPTLSPEDWGQAYIGFVSC